MQILVEIITPQFSVNSNCNAYCFSIYSETAESIYARFTSIVIGGVDMLNYGMLAEEPFGVGLANGMVLSGIDLRTDIVSGVTISVILDGEEKTYEIQSWTDAGEYLSAVLEEEGGGVTE